MLPNAVRTAVLLLLATTLFAAAVPAAAIEFDKKQREEIATLPEEYQEWLQMVELIITEEEYQTFVGLEKDYQRDAFIERFWRVRDKYSDTARNEYRERYMERVREALQVFGALDEDRARILLLNGYPAARVEGRCSGIIKPLEVWFYDGSDQVSFEFFVVFYREGSRYRMWRPFEGIRELQDTLMGSGRVRGVRDLLDELRYKCRDGEVIAAAIAFVLREGELAYGEILGRVQETPDLKKGEWIATFNTYTTDVPAGAPRLPGELTLRFPGHRQSRTAVQGTVLVPRKAAGTAELADYRSHNLLLTGEVLLDDKLFDTFRYKFDLPVADVGGTEKLPLVFQRFLRPGDYRLVVKVEDMNSGAYFREDRQVTVPKVDEALPPPPPEDDETARLLAEANAALARGETTVQILPPQGEIQTGYVRFDTLTTGDDIARVAFALDGDVLLTKGNPPYSVELDLGEVPQPRSLAAVAYDETGDELARDGMLLNQGGHRFRVRLVEPRKGETYRSSLTAEAEVEVPEEATVERVEFFLNETRVATLYQEPWVQPILLPEEEAIAYVRAVAYLPDGNSTEDLVFVNAPDYLEEIDVQFVEVYATVVGRDGRPIEGLSEGDFQVLEDGTPQTIARFERVRDLPIHAGILLDVSASMEGSLEETRQAALGFFEQAVEPKDRASLITFNDHPNLAVKFTNDVNELAGGLAGLNAERGTALYDSVIFSLYYFNGVKGQRALLILSDGKDESSRFSWDQALEYARRAGVAIYAISLRDDAAHKKLSKLAEVTGGRSWLIKDAAELPAIYDDIQRELRSKYLLAYQSNNTSDSKDFRSIEVKVSRPATEVKAMQGYYP